MRFHLVYFLLNRADKLQHSTSSYYFIKSQKQKDREIAVKSGSRKLMEVY